MRRNHRFDVDRLSLLRQWSFLALVLAIGISFEAPVFAEQWPRWRGPRGDGYWEAPKLLSQWPGEGLPEVWKQPIGPAFSGISVAAGRLYTMDRPQGDSEVERVLCLNAQTGQKLWEHIYPAIYGDLDHGKGPRTTPTVHEGRVYTMGAVGRLFCLDAASGKALWSKDFVADYQAKRPEWGFSSSPVIDGDKVIVHAAVKPNGCYLAFDRITGKEIWRGGEEATGYGTPIIIEHAGSRQLIGWTPDHIISLSLADGALNWKIPYEVTYGVSISTPIFREGIVFVSGYWHGSKAIQLGKSPGDAKLLWEENRLLRGLMAQPLYRNGFAYLLDKHHGLSCFQLSSGKVLWNDKNQLTPRSRNPQATLVWAGDTDQALALNSEGELVLARLTPQGLQELCRAKILGKTWAHPAYVGQFVFARDDENIVCVRLPTAK